MKTVDRLIISELVGPWLLGVSMFTVMIAAGQFLFQVTGYLAKGADFGLTVQFMILLLPGIIAKTFSMAVLLGALLAFGRLSGDSEIIALRAAGISLARIMASVAAFGVAVSLLAFGFGEMVVPRATYRAVQIRLDIESQIFDRKEQATARAIFKDGRLQMYLTARDFSISEKVLRGVVLTVYGEDEKPSMFLMADKMEFVDETNWKIIGEARLLDVASGARSIHPDGMFPANVPEPDITPDDLFTQALKELEALSMGQMREQIEREKNNPLARRGVVANLQFGYWNKIALPLAALVFGLLGAPLGIRNHRAGKATGFGLAIAIIFLYFLLTNVMAIAAQGGQVPSYVASFLPVLIGLVTAIVLVQRRNR
ncbi:MAG: LptF/LptG family permease [Armatimonadetes bacterium]|nr:LptF/LptG family permease [Armatimonadota bacterium]